METSLGVLPASPNNFHFVGVTLDSLDILYKWLLKSLGKDDRDSYANANAAADPSVLLMNFMDSWHVSRNNFSLYQFTKEFADLNSCNLALSRCYKARAEGKLPDADSVEGSLDEIIFGLQKRKTLSSDEKKKLAIAELLYASACLLNPESDNNGENECKMTALLQSWKIMIDFVDSNRKKEMVTELLKFLEGLMLNKEPA